MANGFLALTCAFIGALASTCAGSGLEGMDRADLWGMRKAHPAVVNPVCGEDPDCVLSLRGDWEFATPYRDIPTRNGMWGVFPQRDEWTPSRTIRVPGCWEAQGVGEPGPSESWEPTWDNSTKPIRHKYMGEGWYRRRVEIPKAWAGKRIWIKLGGIRSVGWVFVNGRQVAEVDNYCATVKYEITDLVVPGETARIDIDVDNRKPSRKGLMSNVHRWGGIYRDVELEATPQTFIDDAWVRGDFDKRIAEVHVEISGKGEGSGVRVTVEGETVEGKIKQSDNPNNQTIEVPLRNFRPWSPEHPNLYTAKVELVEGGSVIQTRWERFGVRKIEVIGKEFRLNGRPVFFRGFGDDCVYPLTGVSPADRQVHRDRLKKARAAGFNCVRLHTHCEVPEYFEAADELGLMIQAELPYYSDVPTENFAFDPRRDVDELYAHYRRHPSFVTYSMGNEGSFGDALDIALHRHVKAMDPDRLKISQDANFTWQTTADRSDYDGGPKKIWPRGSYAAERPFVCHEYLNLCVKTDSRTAEKYTGVWMPPVTREARARWLAWFGLGQDWGDRLQDAQHALQAVWQKRGIEAARADPGCGGYHFWTIADVVVWNDVAKTFSAQGLFDPFWDDKPHGLTAERFARFNSPSCVLADFKPDVSVFASGEKVSVDVLFAHFGEQAVVSGVLDWKLVAAQGEVLVSGEESVGSLCLGPARKIADVSFVIPSVAKPMKASFVATVRETAGPAFGQANDWDVWLFPKGPSHDEIVREAARRGVVIAAKGSAETQAALARGDNLITVDGTSGRPNVSLGWWGMGQQVGTAIRTHPALGDFPQEGVLSPLWFRLVKDTGRQLRPLEIEPKDLIIVGEGGAACFVYLHELKSGRSRVLECNGLDLLSETPEGNALLGNLVDYLANGRDAEDAR